MAKIEYDFRLKIQTNKLINSRIFEEVMRNAIILYSAKTDSSINMKGSGMSLSFGNINTLY